MRVAGARAILFACTIAAVALALAELAGGPAPAHAQQGAPSLAIAQVDSTRYPEITAVVTVLDTNGVPVPGLRASAFHASDGPAAVAVAGVESVHDANLRLSVVLVIDTSGSMLGAPLDRAKQAAAAFVNALGPNDDVALVAFSDAVRAPVPGFTRDRAALAAGIASLQAGGATVLYQAVQAAVLTARMSPAPRKAIVLLTDGQNDTTTSTATAAGSIGSAKNAGLPVFTIGFGDQPDAGYLQALSSATQGQYSAATAANVGDVYQRIAGLLRGQYVLSLDAARPADGSAGTLRVVADVAGSPVAATAPFTRGAAPAAPAAVTATPPPAAAQASADGGGSGVLSAVIGALVAVLLVVGGLLAFRRLRAVRRQRAVERHAGRQSDESIPFAPPAADTAAAPARGPAGTGRLVERAADGGGRVFELGAGPAIVGSSRRTATILLPAEDGVAPEHARIWLRDGRYLLHHTSGAHRRTLVGGHPADWVVLEPGDDVQFGSLRFVFEDDGPAGADATGG
ncbi:MAG: VWA domain-containing protein [Chloroflexota bacterium]|nr:VWA domain-containing protein [Chloroflexota bacterium]